MRSITVLGSGNSLCKDGRGHTAFLVGTGSGALVLVDAGATVPLRLREHGLGLEALEGVVLTHFHGDHTLGLPFLLYEQKTRYRRDRPLTVLGPAGTGALVGDLLQVSRLGSEHGYPIEIVEFEPEGEARIGGLLVQSRPVTHRPESLGYRFVGEHGRVVAFSGDCRFDDRLTALVRGADIAFVEVGLPAGPLPGVAHVSFEELRARRRELEVGRLVLVHLDDGIAASIDRAALGEPAHDGLRVDL